MLPSREELSRHVQSLGNLNSSWKEKNVFPFQKLKSLKMASIGKALRKSECEIDFFGLRDLNARPRSPELQQEVPLFQLVESDGSMEDTHLHNNNISCLKCNASLSKIPTLKTQPTESLRLKYPSLELTEKPPEKVVSQLQLQPHLVKKRKNLPPLLFSAHIPEPPGYNYDHDSSIIKEAKLPKGKKVNGRLKEGINWEFLFFLEKQKLIQQASLKPLNPNPKYSMKLKKVNLFMAKTGGNVLGKALQKLQKDSAIIESDQKEQEMILREKEKQIDDLIFGKKQQITSVEELMEMKDFL